MKTTHRFCANPGPSVAIGQLDGLRAISILLVLAAHLFPLGPKSVQLNAMAGTTGMALFFVLSGYLIARSLSRETVMSFVAKRAARIVPLAYLYLTLIAIVYGLSGSSLLSHLLFFVNYVPERFIPQTQHMWSLCVEMHFYAFVAIIAFLDRRLVYLVWPLMVAVIGMRIYHGAPYSIASHLRVDEILAGACIATLPRNFIDRILHPARMCIAAAVLLLFASHPDAGAFQYVRSCAAGILLATLLTPTVATRARWLAHDSLRYVARISYALYIIHPLTAFGWWNAGSVGERYLLKRPIALAVTFVLAHLSTFYWERPFTRGVRRLLSSRITRQPAL